MRLTRGHKEVEAESVAFTVCKHYGIDTDDYSFAYVAGWSEGKDTPELKASLDTIRRAAAELITASMSIFWNGRKRFLSTTGRKILSTLQTNSVLTDLQAKKEQIKESGKTKSDKATVIPTVKPSNIPTKKKEETR